MITTGSFDFAIGCRDPQTQAEEIFLIAREAGSADALGNPPSQKCKGGASGKHNADREKIGLMAGMGGSLRKIQNEVTGMGEPHHGSEEGEGKKEEIGKRLFHARIIVV